MGDQKNKHLLQNTLLITISLIITTVMAETLLKIISFEPKFLWPEQNCFRDNKQDLTRIFTLDPEFGFRPILGNSLFNKYGTRVNGYDIEKKQNKERLLFIGDSVTARGKIINALRKLYGEEEFEYWNAGVESFNTVQEVKFYEKYNKHIKPDHVILFSHNNDIQTTPVVFLNNENKIVVYSPFLKTYIVSRWLFKHSALYRIIIANYLKLVYKNSNSNAARKLEDEVIKNIKRLKNILDQEHIKFTLVFLPVIDSYDKWSKEEKESRLKILKIAQELGIKYFDLTEVILRLPFESAEIVRLSTDGDRCHPEDGLSLSFADFLFKKEIFR